MTIKNYKAAVDDVFITARLMAVNNNPRNDRAVLQAYVDITYGVMIAQAHDPGVQVEDIIALRDYTRSREAELQDFINSL